MGIVLGQSVAVYLTIILGIWVLLHAYLKDGSGWKKGVGVVLQALQVAVFCYVYYIVVLR